ncbi:RHS repeat-associated core domain-containing protein [Burkholderia ubonensis]|uniref:RHS repeat-associated core domain-containing protein n=1 Tax=Burkholderia ubonensis TaxID=101571 RepID=UPI0009B34CE3|nr:RHS repeat-associated core domain-containing protein [Burkholderia ubonensis]
MSDSENRLVRASDPPPRDETRSESKVDTSCDALLDTIKSTCDPFKETFSSKGSSLHHISEAVNALCALQGAPSQLLNTGIAQIPLLDKMPGMPAATIGAAHLGTPHAHDHPPSDGFPLPSMGGTIGAGCLSVLIGGIPAARVMDIGIAPTCGGLTPLFNVETGSSNTFIGGMRAARMGIDMTRHCNPMGHAGKSGEEAERAAEKGEEAAGEAAEVSSGAGWLGRAGKAWKVGNVAVGPASGVAGAAADVKHGEELAAAMMAAQTAADAAMMALSNLMGKDPGIEPSMGMLMDGNPTVLIGGAPVPDSQMMWHGIKHGLGKKVRPKVEKWAQKLACELWGEPVSAVTGEVKNDFTDYGTGEVIPFKWGRHYCSGWHERDGVLGYGFRHAWQHELQLLRTRAIYKDPRGTEYVFSRRADGTYGCCRQGYEIEQVDSRRFIVRHEVSGDLEFERTSTTDRPARCVGHVRDGAYSALHWNSQGRIGNITQADARGNIRRVVAFGYDRFERIVEVVLTDVDGQINRIARYGYDANGCLVSCRNALDAVSASEYDAQRRVARLTDANGYSFFYHYDGEGRCVESSGQDGMWHVRFEYQPGRTMVTEGDGGKWTVLYNDVGTITRVVDPYGGATEYVIGGDGRITEEIDSGGRVLRWLYDEHARNTGRVDRCGYLYQTENDATALRGTLAYTVAGTQFDLLWGNVDPIDTVDMLMLPPEIATVVTPLFGEDIPASSIEQRDAAGRVVARTDEYGRTERFQYDSVGNLVQIRDKDGRDYYYHLASWKLRGGETDAMGNTVRYRYTSKRKIGAIVDANGNEVIYAYDLKDRISAVYCHGALNETYTYDAGGRLIEKRDHAGSLLLRFEIGENGLPEKRILSSGETHLYEYDTIGSFTKASTNNFEITRAYDVYGHQIKDERDGRGVEHNYVGRCLATTTYFKRFSVHYGRSPNGDLVIHAPVGNVHRLQHASNGEVLLRLGNKTNLLLRFDMYGRCLGRLTWQEGHAASIHHIQYQYSEAGQLRRVIDSTGTSTDYEYDAANRLICEKRGGWSLRRFEYDRGGNLLSTPALTYMHYSEGNRLLGTSSGAFFHNDRNHLSEQVDGNQRITYQYNSMDLLVKVTWNNREEIWTAEYDGLCRRVYQALGDNRVDYFWDDDRLAAEISSNGRLRIYVYPNPAAIVPFMFIDYASLDASPDSGQAYFLFHNQIGQPEHIEDEGGAVVWQAREIDPFGMVEVADGNRIEYNLRFPGHYFDAATSLHYNRFRTYSPILGRYLQADPSGQAGGINLYAYVKTPLISVDIFGLHDENVSESDSAVPDNNQSGSHVKQPGYVQPDLWGEVHAPPAHRPPQLTREEGQAIVDQIHTILRLGAQKQTTTGLTELQDGRIAITSSEDTISPEQRVLAWKLLQDAGFEPHQLVFTDGEYLPNGDLNPHFQPNWGGRDFGRLGYDEEEWRKDEEKSYDPPNCHHAEQKGVQAGLIAGSPAVRQWSSAGVDPSDPERGGHGGAACPHCARVQKEHGIVNETGVQPLTMQPSKGKSSPFLNNRGRMWNGRPDRINRVFPGHNWGERKFPHMKPNDDPDANERRKRPWIPDD